MRDNRIIDSKVFKIFSCFSVLALCLFGPLSSLALEDPQTELDNIGIYTKLGDQVDLSLQFVDSSGEKITLGQIADGHPLIIVPAYFDCPRLCGLVLKGVVKLINSLTLRLGDDYRVAVVSFDPLEGPKVALNTAQQYQGQVIASMQGGVPTSFRFLTGSKESINTLLTQLNFKMTKDGDEYAHTSAIMILTQQGKISQYLSGIEFSSFDARLALVEASHGSIGNPLDHAFLFCFRFDPKKGKYTWAAFNLMRVGGLLTLASLVFLVIRLARSSRTS